MFYSWHDSDMVKTCLHKFCVFAFKLGVSSTHVQMQYVRAFLVGVWSTGVKIHFLSNLAWEAFGQPKLRYIICPLWHGVYLVNTSLEAFCFLVGMLLICSTQVEIQAC